MMKTFWQTLLLAFAAILLSFGVATAESGQSDDAMTDSGSKAFGDVLLSWTPPEPFMRDILFVNGRMFQITKTNYNILELNPANGALVQLHQVNTIQPSGGLEWDGSMFIVDDYFADLIHWVDPGTGNSTASIPAPEIAPSGLYFDGTFLWSLGNNADKIYKLDPSDGTVLSSFDVVAGSNYGLSYDGQVVWYANNTKYKIYGYELTTGALVKSVTPPPNDFLIGTGFDGRYLWAVTENAANTNTNHKIDIEYDGCMDAATCDDSNECTDDTCDNEFVTDDLPWDDSNYTDTTLIRGNIFEVTEAVVLLALRTKLDVGTDSDITAVVYESDTDTGPYTLIGQKTVTLTANGTDVYEIPGLNIGLQAGLFYAIGYTWDSPSIAFYFSSVSLSQVASFGNVVGNILDNGIYLPATPSPFFHYARFHMQLDTMTLRHCINTDNSNPCDDGEFCNGTDTCNAGACSDHVGTPCPSNGEFCDGEEICDEASDACDIASIPDCDDGVDCTDDACDEAGDACVNATNDTLCDDATFCNGAETCDATNGCEAGDAPCAGDETCNEIDDTCDPLTTDDDDDDDTDDDDDDTTDDDDDTDDDTSGDDDDTDAPSTSSSGDGDDEGGCCG